MTAADLRSQIALVELDLTAYRFVMTAGKSEADCWKSGTFYSFLIFSTALWAIPHISCGAVLSVTLTYLSIVFDSWHVLYIFTIFNEFENLPMPSIQEALSNFSPCTLGSARLDWPTDPKKARILCVKYSINYYYVQ